MRQFLLRLLVIFGVYRLLTIRPLNNVAFFQDQSPLVAVDKGGAGQTLADFATVRDAGANSLYLPVALTRDGMLVVTDSDVAELALAELRSVDAFGGIITLQEALAANPDLRAVVVVQQPSLQTLAALLQAVDANSARLRVLAVVDHPLLADTLREQAPDLGTATTTAETSAFLTTRRFRLTPFYRPAAPAMLLEGSEINKRLVDAARGRGIHVLALAGQPSVATAQALIDAGVDGVIVTDPALIGQLSWQGQDP